MRILALECVVNPYVANAYQDHQVRKRGVY
jgi:hypothetical protein